MAYPHLPRSHRYIRNTCIRSGCWDFGVQIKLECIFPQKELEIESLQPIVSFPIFPPTQIKDGP